MSVCCALTELDVTGGFSGRCLHCVDIEPRVVLLISAGGRGCWLFSPRGPAPAASTTSGAETAASAEGHIDKGNAAAAAPTAAAGTDPFTSSSRSQKHPGNPST